MEILGLAKPPKEKKKISSKKKMLEMAKRKRRASASFSDSAALKRVCFTFNHDYLSHFHLYNSLYILKYIHKFKTKLNV